MPANTALLVAEGDSITVGSGATPYTRYLTLDFPSAWDIHNIAVSGSGIQGCLDRIDSTVAPLAAAAPGKKLVVLWVGTNDFNLRSVDATWALMVQYADRVHALGCAVVVVPTISRAGEDAYKNALNALIYANYAAHFDGIADVASNPHLGADGAYANSTYFQTGGIHPTTFAAQTIEAPIVSAACNAAIVKAPPEGPLVVSLVISNLTSGGSSSSATSYTTASISPSVGNLLLVAVVAGLASALGSKAEPPQISGDGIAFNLLGTLSWVTYPAIRLSLFWAIVPASVSSGALTVSFTNATLATQGCSWSVDSVSGIDSTAPISWCVQAGAVNNNATTTTPTVTLLTPQDSSSLFYGALVANIGTANTSPGTGWTQLSERAFGGATFNVEYKVNDASVTWTLTPSPVINMAFGVEITAANSGARNNPLQSHDLGCVGSGV